jgi:radical SAM family uncharacterized protein/radical SAM-linked protein
MGHDVLRDLLPLVEKPSRYLGNEVNAVYKDLGSVRLKIALAFPDLYDIGMSHLGIQILYHILNRDPNIAAERVFAPGLDLAGQMKQSGAQLCSLESATPLSRFDVIGFSLLYELNYSNVLMMLALAGVPFRAADRDLDCPVVIAGGPCTVNPEPVADFFDAMLVGDGETAFLEMAGAWMAWKEGGGRDKAALLKSWTTIEGVYVPRFFEPQYDASGFQSVKPVFSGYSHVLRRIEPDLDAAPFPEAPVVPYGKPVHDRLRLEVARGCTRGCRFCQAGMIYRPVRERSLENLISLVDRALSATGYDEVSLLSLSTGDYGCLTPLMQHLMGRYAQKNVSVSLPSFRAGTLSPEMMALIRQVRKTGFTIAPEAGSERLRSVINKNISEKEVLDTVTHAFALGWTVIKLYFMIGLPTETDEDILAIVDLIERIRRVRPKGKRPPVINVSLATFIPKPHVPFQWTPQIPLEESQDKIFGLRSRLRLPGVQVKWQKPEASFLEGLWARGDRRLSRLLEAAYHRGCRFDGWTDLFRYDLWKAAFADAGMDPGFYITRKREVSEPLPWDHVDVRVSKKFLISEYDKAMAGEQTPDCRTGDCRGCGVCDFNTIMPKTHAPKPEPSSVPSAESRTGAESVNIRVEVIYAKTGPARYFGHLELVNIFFRAIRRAGIPIRFTEGFHPKPKISFHDPLPVGMESTRESFLMTVTGKIDIARLAEALNAGLPQGLLVLQCGLAASSPEPSDFDGVVYTVTLSDGVFDPLRLEAFLKASEWIFHQKRHNKGLRRIDLKTAVAEISLRDKDRLRMRFSPTDKQTLRPAEVVSAIFHLPDERIRRAIVVKTVENAPLAVSL